MDSYIIDDVEALLKLKKGNFERLNRIKDLCENNKLVPISDRKYLERLASQYVYQKESKEKKPEPEFVKTKDVEELSPSKEISSQVIEQYETEEEYKPELTKLVESSKVSKKSKKFGSRQKIVFGISAIIIGIVVVSIFTLSGNGISFTDIPVAPTKTSELSPPYVTIAADESSYQKSDIISISGESNPKIQETVKVSIENSERNVVWSENVQVKDNGEFSTLLIAAGPGWEKSGRYNLLVNTNNLNAQVWFDFTA